MLIVFFKVFQVITRKNPESVLCAEKSNIGTNWAVRKRMVLTIQICKCNVNKCKFYKYVKFSENGYLVYGKPDWLQQTN